MKIPLFVFFIVGFALNSVGSIMRSLWLTDWSDSTLIDLSDEQLPNWIRLLIYTVLGVIEIVFLAVGLFCLLFGGINASLNLHNPLLLNLLRSPLSFFDTTPLGRILNRTGKVSKTLFEGVFRPRQELKSL